MFLLGWNWEVGNAGREKWWSNADGKWEVRMQEQESLKEKAEKNDAIYRYLVAVPCVPINIMNLTLFIN